MKYSLDLFVRETSEQQVTHRYAEEVLKLKTLNHFGWQSEGFLGYLNTLMMNLCRRVLERRGMPIPLVGLSKEKHQDLEGPN